jgi:hypothetical protein
MIALIDQTTTACGVSDKSILTNGGNRNAERL